ncbi:MAG TPA: hemolysin family protein [Thermoanaerobaculia bacterium]|nr:hemolysin family protein [Thermoanaerobaculia bacterium]
MTESSIGLQVLIVLLLILANGIFAMSEIAVVSARKARLRHMANEGNESARRALAMAEHPTRFLSTVQIGITLVGIFAGAYSGATIAAELDAWLERFPLIDPWSEAIALGSVVLMITYLTLIIGELVPKRIALAHPEKIASFFARPMNLLSRFASPLVTLLSASTDALLRLFGFRKSKEPPVTEEEIAAMMAQGTEAGIFEEQEQDLVERVFWLADQQVGALMIPRHKIVWLDLEDPIEINVKKMFAHPYSRFLVCRGAIDQPLGFVHVKDLWARLVDGQPPDLQPSLRNPLYVPENMRALRLMDLFRETGVHLAVVVDEYGGVEGLATLNDVLEEISGDLTAPAFAPVTRRDDGSWLMDGSLSLDDFWEAVGLDDPREDERREYRTLGGFVFTQLGHVPSSGESFQALGMRFEVVDMDRNRVAKVLVDFPPQPV